jgi:hypothetical protein
VDNSRNAAIGDFVFYHDTLLCIITNTEDTEQKGLYFTIRCINDLKSSSAVPWWTVRIADAGEIVQWKLKNETILKDFQQAK